jgi:hypothetical protein
MEAAVPQKQKQYVKLHINQFYLFPFTCGLSGPSTVLTTLFFADSFNIIHFLKKRGEV